MKKLVQNVCGILLCVSLGGCWKGDDKKDNPSHHATSKKENGDVVINGVANFNDQAFENLIVNGVANVHNVSVHHETVINGVLTAGNSNFDTITISTTHMALNNCTVNSIIVRQTEPKKEQIVELSNSSVNGSITFEQGNGKVIVKNGSAIKGNITGGVLVSE